MCHYRRHLKGPDLTTYELALALSKHSGTFFASADYISEQTAYKAPQTIRNALSRLRRDGWLVKVGGNRDKARKGGKFTPNAYRVVTHDQWAAAHSGRCGSEPIRVSPDTAEGAGADTAQTQRADTAHTLNNLSSRSEKRELSAQERRAAWTALGIEPVGDECFRQRFERQFQRSAELLEPLNAFKVPEFLESFFSGCLIDGERIPPEFRAAAKRLRADLD